MRNPHVQTVISAFWPDRLPEHGAIARTVPLPDGDTLVVHDDCPPGWQPGDRAVLLSHGLCGCHRSPLLVRLTQKLTQRGARVFRMDLRGCGAGFTLAKQPYHAGRSDDLAAAIDAVLGWCRIGSPDVLPMTGQPKPTPLALFGVSLSGNILLKYLGTNPAAIPAQVDRALAVNPPIDLARSVQALSKPLNRWYDRYFARILVDQAIRYRGQWPDMPAAFTGPLPRTLAEFDDRFTAPSNGFLSGADYYAQCSAGPLLQRIALPTRIITAKDDPLVPYESFEPYLDEFPETVKLTSVKHGGHVGYRARPGIDPDVHWLEWRVVEWALSA
jgi:predicted alpha/beta-fold hydrolase